jgi:dienelactone hydrolase
MKPRSFGALIVALCSCVLTAQSPSPDAARAAFLKLIDRPRVALAPEVRSLPAPDAGLREEHVSVAAEADDRIPMLLVESAAGTGRRPAVIFLHGTGGNKEQQLSRLKMLAQRGFVAVAIDARYHGERARGVAGPAASPYSNAIYRSFQTGKEHPFFFDTVWDVMRTIDYLQARADVDGSRIGLAGFSKGGVETYLAAAVEPRIAAAVSGHGVQSFQWGLDHSGWDSRAWTIRDAIEPAAADAKSGVNAQFLRRFYDRVAPGIYGQFDGPSMLALAAPRPFLVVVGDSDPRTPMGGVRECAAAAEKSYAAAGAAGKFSLLVEENVGHEQTPVFNKSMVEWFARWLQTAAPASGVPAIPTANAGNPAKLPGLP